jgi:uncharacterized membrane protein YfcA
VTPLLLAAGAALFAGLLSGIFGIGGGVVLVPLLGLILGLDQHDAQGVTLAILLLPIGATAVLEYHRAGAVRWRLVAPLVGGFLGGVAAGSLGANALPERALRLLFVLFLFTIALRGWRASSAPTPPAARAAHARRVGHAVWIGAAGGLASGLLGIGGAVVMIPALVTVLGLSQHEAQGTSLATMLPPIGLPGVWIYAQAKGGLPWGAMGWAAAGFLVGGALGARLAVRTPGPRLVRGFAIFQGTVALILLSRAARG